MADQPAQGFGRDSIAALGNSMSKAPEERETVQRAGQFKDLTVQQSWRWPGPRSWARNSAGPAGQGRDQAYGEAALQPLPDSPLPLSPLHAPMISTMVERSGAQFLEQTLAGGVSESKGFRRGHQAGGSWGEARNNVTVGHLMSQTQTYCSGTKLLKPPKSNSTRTKPRLLFHSFPILCSFLCF